MKRLKILLSIIFVALPSLGICATSSFVTPPTGSNGEVQFNKNHRFGSDPTFTYSTTTKRLNVSSAAVTYIEISTASIVKIRFSDGTEMITAAIGGGTSVYPATATALFTSYGFRSSTGTFTSTFTATGSLGTMTWNGARTLRITNNAEDGDMLDLDADGGGAQVFRVNAGGSFIGDYPLRCESDGCSIGTSGAQRPNYYIASPITGSVLYVASDGLLMQMSPGTSGQVVQTQGVGNPPTMAFPKPLFDETFNPDQAKLPNSNPCVISNSTNQVTSFLLCDASTDESVTWSTILSPHQSMSTIKVGIQYSMASATSGNVVLTAQLMCVTSGDSADVDTESFASVGSATDAVPGTAGYLGDATITPTDDSCAANDLIVLKVSRDADNGSDTASGDVEIRKVRLYAE